MSESVVWLEITPNLIISKTKNWNPWQESYSFGISITLSGICVQISFFVSKNFVYKKQKIESVSKQDSHSVLSN